VFIPSISGDVAAKEALSQTVGSTFGQLDFRADRAAVVIATSGKAHMVWPNSSVCRASEIRQKSRRNGLFRFE
jgi:hypothetical protein